MLQELNVSLGLQDQAEFIHLHAFLPNQSNRTAAKLWKAGNEDTFFYINTRRLLPSADQAVKQCLSEIRQVCAHGSEELSRKYPFIWVHVELPPRLTDVNVEPDKTSVLVTVPDRLQEA